MKKNSLKSLFSIRLAATEIISLWQDYCSLHNDLYDLTSLEYSKLIQGEIDDIDFILHQKEELIHEIKKVDILREKVITNFSLVAKEKITCISDLKEFLLTQSLTEEIALIDQTNELLKNIISKIQGQNKKKLFIFNKVNPVTTRA